MPAGVVALVLVLLVVVVVVGVVVVVVVLEVDEVLVDEVLVGVDGVEAVCWWHSRPANSAIVAAPWVRFARRVGLIVTGRVWTSLLSTALAFTAAPQLPAWTAVAIWSAWPLSAFD